MTLFKLKANAMTFKYQTWGLAENTGEATTLKSLTSKYLEKILDIINKISDIEKFQIKSAKLTEHYQGKSLKSKKLAWLRLERCDGKNTELNGEHISAIIDINTFQLIGFTRMEKALAGEISVNHQIALNLAVEFLQQFASDLISHNITTSQLNFKTSDLKSDDKIEFNPALNIDKIQVHWIGQHTEEIISQQEKIEIHGIKVKMYIPATQLWAWVIIDKNKNILTFERDIFWNFDEFKRETQMWLHDKWIETHKINLDPVQ